MPPFLSTFRSRTNSMLDNITGIIPDSPSSSTSKDNSLTCRRCGNRFRDRLELSSHFNLLPHHSDYKDSYDFASFTRPKGRRRTKTRETSNDPGKSAEPTQVVSPITASFSETQAYYQDQQAEKDHGDDTRPTFLRKFSTLSNLNLSAIPTGDQPLSPPATDYADQDANQSPRSPKAKGKQKAAPRLPRDGSFQYGQPLASSDEEDNPTAFASPSSSTRFADFDSRPRARSATIQGLISEPVSYHSSSSIASRSSGANRPASPLPPKLPAFDWQTTKEKALPNFPDQSDDTASVASDSSFRTATSIEMGHEKAQLKARYAADEKSSNKPLESSGLASSSMFERPAVHRPNDDRERGEQRRRIRSRARHGSESNLLLESMGASYDDAPPSYHDLHGDSDPFDTVASGSRRPSRHMASRSDGFATMPASPVTRFPRRPRLYTDQGSRSTADARFPVSFSSHDDARRNDEDDLYSSRSEKAHKGPVRPPNKSRTTDANMPALVTSSSSPSSPSPSSPKTPFDYMAEAPLTAPPLALPRPHQSPKASSSGRRSRHTSRAKSDAAAPSTRCPTCFAKFASLDKTLEHLDSSDCGAVEFESGIN
ncbi:hypothetical protein EX895_001306 [Sporisorium graminicola]|uniref:C2H2-type domain-containing protein n=1 Tax=Sporisorium graminicola TaxID=280036 RepID=A0A4U7KXL0_9BASI|nr:hypothetical protein EX895_001306 [Sporisorium graminicola]TKY89521.1 hypothetical protein EX895_001306 [Sporisorium graminicola]